MLNGESITERVQHLLGRIEALRGFRELSREAYLRDTTVQAAVERHFQVAIECCLDIAKHIIVGRSLQPPTELRQVFQYLREDIPAFEMFAAFAAGLLASQERDSE